MQRLHGVDDAHVRPLLLERRADRPEIGLGEDPDRLGAAEPGRAERDLRRGLLARHEQRLPPARATAPSALRSSVDLPTPGSPPTSTSEAGTMPPPSTRSSSGTPVEMRSPSLADTSPSGVGAARDARLPSRRRSRAAPPRASRMRRSQGICRATAGSWFRTPCRRAGRGLSPPSQCRNAIRRPPSRKCAYSLETRGAGR